jgi:hypothetical protein
MIRKEYFGARNHFLDINDDCSAQDRRRELKLVSLKLPGDEDSACL